ncbi:hypothetical protein [Salinimicrobium gaetbulicola]|uniref:YbbR-like protein n=1 Tax=Salinimicrobium gaetbulicola TaxID=999702 RepID=A0ABW3IBJ4_9FLAO
MNKPPIKILIFLITFNLFSQNTDTVSIPDNVIRPMLELHVKINEPVELFPLIKSDDLETLNFNLIKSSALEIEKNLELVFIEYYSESKAAWSKKDFTDYFEVKSMIKERSLLDYYHINFDIDTTKNQSILNSEPLFESGISFIGSDSHTEFVRQIIPKNNDSINHFGNLPVKIKYLIDFDTIKLSKKDIGKEFKIAEEEYRLDNIINGNIHIRSLDSSNELEKLEISRYIAYKDQKIVHLPHQNRFPLSFNILKTSSIFLNDSLVQLPHNDYQKYLKNIKFAKNEVFVDQIILDTEVDFDEIHILLPKYHFLNKELKSRIEKENIDNLKIVRHSSQIKTPTPKNQPLNN